MKNHEKIAETENVVEAFEGACGHCGAMLPADIEALLQKDPAADIPREAEKLYNVRDHWLSAYENIFGNIVCEQCLELFHDEFSGPPSNIGDESWEDFCDHEDFDDY